MSSSKCVSLCQSEKKWLERNNLDTLKENEKDAEKALLVMEDERSLFKNIAGFEEYIKRKDISVFEHYGGSFRINGDDPEVKKVELSIKELIAWEGLYRQKIEAVKRTRDNVAKFIAMEALKTSQPFATFSERLITNLQTICNTKGVCGIIFPIIRDGVFERAKLFKDPKRYEQAAFVFSFSKKIVAVLDYDGSFYAKHVDIPHYSPNSLTRILLALDKDFKGAMYDLGKEYGICFACGSALTDQESKRIGMGPICSGRMKKKLDMIRTEDQEGGNVKRRKIEN